VWVELVGSAEEGRYIRHGDSTHCIVREELSPLAFHMVGLTSLRALISDLLPVLGIIVFYTLLALFITGARGIRSLNGYVHDITSEELKR
jgi:hypothetical protein